ncbi:MAG: tetratricopeptide repeat protein [Chitinophagaceae bacterium]|nr:tetratricopeptide repeat protein [Chitinophagaceae bacterium]
MHLFKIFYTAALALLAVSCNNSAKPEKINTPEKIPVTTVDEQMLGDSTLADTVREQMIEKLVQGNQTEKALSQIEMLLKKDSTNPGWLYMKADALERSGDTSGAIAFYNKAVNKAGIFIKAEMRAANLFAETGNKNALILCDRLLKNPAAVRLRSDVLLMKGIYYTKVKNSAKALEQFTQIIREDYSYLDAYIEKGLVYYDGGNYTEAWKVFNKSTEVSNKFADGYYWMARAEEKMNKKQDAIDNFKRALALDQNLSEAREGLKRLEELK